MVDTSRPASAEAATHRRAGYGRFIVVRNTHRISASKAVAVAIGVCIAIGLAIEAPVHAALPTAAAERLVTARIQHRPVGKEPDRPAWHRHARHRKR